MKVERIEETYWLYHLTLTREETQALCDLLHNADSVGYEIAGLRKAILHQSPDHLRRFA